MRVEASLVAGFNLNLGAGRQAGVPAVFARGAATQGGRFSVDDGCAIGPAAGGYQAFYVDIFAFAALVPLHIIVLKRSSVHNQRDRPAECGGAQWFHVVTRGEPFGRRLRRGETAPVDGKVA